MKRFLSAWRAWRALDAGASTHQAPATRLHDLLSSAPPEPHVSGTRRRVLAAVASAPARTPARWSLPTRVAGAGLAIVGVGLVLAVWVRPPAGPSSVPGTGTVTDAGSQAPRWLEPARLVVQVARAEEVPVRLERPMHQEAKVLLADVRHSARFLRAQLSFQ